MTAINQAQFEMLISLQNIEFSRIEVQKTLDAVAARVDRLENELKAHSDAIEEEKQALQAEKTAYADFEEQIQTNDTLIAKIEEKRRSVKTEREYQMLLKEEEQLRARKSQIEEDMIACMDKMETATQTIAVKEAELVQIREQVEGDIQSVRQEASARLNSHRNGSRWRRISTADCWINLPRSSSRPRTAVRWRRLKTRSAWPVI